jgi:ribosome-associated protein
MANPEVNKMLAAAVEACEDKKAEDIRILKLDPAESGLSDYFLICNGTNERQNVAITDEIELRLKRDFGNYPNAVEGRRQGEWVLMDYVDFIVHVFSPEKRAFYGLERLRKSATTLSLNDLNAEIKAAITARRRAKTPAKASAKSTATKSAAKKAVSTQGPAKEAPKKSAAKKSTPTKSAAKKSAPTKAVAKKSASAKSSPKKTSAKAKPGAVKPRTSATATSAKSVNTQPTKRLPRK